MKRFLSHVVNLVFALSLLSCEKEKVVAVTSVSVSPSSAELFIGETAQLSATVLPSDATDKTVSWSTSNPSVASISSSGLVTATAEGTVTITASAGGKNGTCTVTVSKRIIAVSSVELSITSLELVEGESETLTATVKPDDATDKTVIWLSSNVSVASVDNGIVVAVSEGATTITAQSGDKSASCEVVVKKKIVAVESVELSETTLTLTEGDSYTLTATIKPDDATDKSIAWSSSNNSVASVDNGTVTAVKEGAITITATAGEKSASCEVTVQKKLVPTSAIELDRTFVALLAGESITLKPNVTPSNTTDIMTWSTDTPDIVSVDNGLVKALSDGTGKVYVHSGQFSDVCEIAVVSTSAEGVDLGVSVQWASTNIGASKPSDYGHYYAWGELEPKNEYSWSSYKWGDGSRLQLTKYVTDASYGIVDNRSRLSPDDDVAYQTLGGKWRLPSKEEFDELRQGARWTLAELDGSKGYVVTNKVTGKCIFLPLSGVKSQSSLYSAGENGNYWSCNFKFSSNSMAWYLWIPSYDVNAIVVQDNIRYVGYPVRAVYGDAKPIEVEAVSLNTHSISIYVGNSETLTAAILPVDATNQAITWVSSDPAVATVTDGVVTGVSKGTATINASIDGKTDACTVTVVNPIPAGAVDLGLSVYWADCNIGASSPEEYGDYYAFGETESKANYYWDTYKWCNKETTQTVFTKYYASDTFSPGTIDNQGAVMDGKKVLEPEDDVAHVRLGGKWRMPTREELLELKNSCSWAFTSSNGVSGVQVTNVNTGECIFLPAAGSMLKTVLKNKGEGGIYMSASVSTDNVSEEWALHFNMSNSYRDVTYLSTYRCCGYTVRAVCDKE